MSACPEIVATGITPEKYQTLLATAKAQGLDLTGATGSTIPYTNNAAIHPVSRMLLSITLHCPEAI